MRLILPKKGSSFTSAFEREIGAALARPELHDVVKASDLEHLPRLVRAHLQRSGVVGKPRVRDVHVVLRGWLKQGPDAVAMPSEVEQFNFFDEPARFFFMRASKWGIPMVAYHRYVGPEATFRVRVASLLEVVDARGPQMDQSETVTMFNDMCFLAPATLPFAPIEWSSVDARTVRAAFTNAGHTIRADLIFDDDGDLVSFVSDDRFKSSDGHTFERLRWSTPMRRYADFHGTRLASEGEAMWREANGKEWAYIHFELVDVRYNVGTSEPLPVARARA